MFPTCFLVLSLTDGWNTHRALGGRRSLCSSSQVSSTKSSLSFDSWSAFTDPSTDTRGVLMAWGASNLKKNRVYSFSMDSKSMFPPMHSMMALVITKPRPVPLTFAAVWSAGWQNGTNSACCLSAGIPTPLSLTSNESWEVLGLSGTGRISTMNCTSAVRVSFAVAPPCPCCFPSAVRASTFELYLIALSTKLMQHCRNRKKSPTNLVLKCSGWFISINSSTPLELAFCEMSVTCSMSCRIVHTSSDSSMLSLEPLLPSVAPSNFAKSKIWLIKPSSASAEVSDALMNEFVKSVSSPDSMARVLKPIILFSGVRSSCVMLKKKARCTLDMCTAKLALRSSSASMNRSDPALITSEYVNFVKTSLYRYRSCCCLHVRRPYSVRK
mmetsp:Transcript_9686/g.35941  ORF Transcript_9686/g.35941 Transcript_9686/m.35941 type:complete len:383 (+) Transcript_9686:2359-3507(+)